MPSIEIVGRQFEITPAVRTLVELALSRLDAALTLKPVQVFLASARRRIQAEIHLEFRGQKLSSEAEAGDVPSALADAVSKLERQAEKLKARLFAAQRRPRPHRDAGEPAKKKSRVEAEAEQRPQRMVSVGAAGLQTIPVVVHDFPARVKVTETHVVRSENAVAKKKMSLEEAVKEMEFNDRDVFVFRDAAGKINVLYRSREGKLELIAVP